jgi:hypothetical protein
LARLHQVGKGWAELKTFAMGEYDEATTACPRVSHPTFTISNSMLNAIPLPWFSLKA